MGAEVRWRNRAVAICVRRQWLCFGCAERAIGAAHVAAMRADLQRLTWLHEEWPRRLQLALGEVAASVAAFNVCGLAVRCEACGQAVDTEPERIEREVTHADEPAGDVAPGDRAGASRPGVWLGHG